MEIEYSDAQIMGILKQAASGVPVADLCRKQPQAHPQRNLTKSSKRPSIHLRFMGLRLGLAIFHS